MNYVSLVAGWLVYFLLHSLLASMAVKKGAQQVLGSAFRFYRLGYTLVSSVGLVVLLIMNGSIESAYYFERGGVVRFLSLVFTTFGVMLIQVSFRQYRLKAFLGFEPEVNSLRLHGVLTWIRHPIYSGLILILIGFFLFIPNQPTLVSCGCAFIYLPIGIYLEERKMILEFGQRYLDYRKEVPALVPRWSRITGRLTLKEPADE
ncbi:MAG: hypothetical protein JNL40_14755 [Cyclobacteriaceae bacterium]|nr:hypothetical protein [Cyclobacteriaceae bacterium]